MIRPISWNTEGGMPCSGRNGYGKLGGASLKKHCQVGRQSGSPRKRRLGCQACANGDFDVSLTAIDVFVVAASNTVFGSGIGYSVNSKACNAATIKNCLWDYLDYGPDGQPIAANKWMLASVDGNGGGVAVRFGPAGPGRHRPLQQEVGLTFFRSCSLRRGRENCPIFTFSARSRDN